MKPILETKNLCVSYGNTKILEDINISVNRCEILAIVGESGCGKSTLLKSLIRLMPSNAKIEKGEINYQNRDLLKLSNEELRQMKSNVHISALCPGPVATEFNQVAHGTFAIREANSYEVAEYAINKLFKKKMIIVPTFMMKLTLFFNRFAPHRLSLMIAYHIQMRKEKGNNK